MAQDPTSKNREAVSGFFKKIIPESSPIMQSGGDTITPEARAKMEAQKAANAAPEALPEVEAPMDGDFVNPVNAQPAQRAPSNAAPSPTPVSGGMDAYSSGLKKEAAATDALGKQEADAYAGAENKMSSAQKELEDIQRKQDEAFTQFKKEDDEFKRKIENFEIKPKELFHGKSTWQKILGGIGMFLGSITPEGAKGVQNIINKEIDRDIEMQKQQYQLMKDKRSDNKNIYQMKIEKIGNDRLALISMKQDALAAVEVQLKKLQANSKGQMARAKLEQGLGMVQMEQEKNNAARAVEWAKLYKDQSKGGIPGFEGSNQNPALVKDITERVAAKNSAMIQIANIERLIKSGAKNPLGANSDLAKQTRKALAADLAKAMFGRSSDSELEMAMDLIPDITSLMRTDSTAQKLLNQLKAKLNSDVDAAANAAGFYKTLPIGARKV